MKMKMEMKKRLHRYDINRPRSRHRHKYSKCKKCLSTIMVKCIKQHVSNIWSSIHEKVKQCWGSVKKKSVAYKKSVYHNQTGMLKNTFRLHCFHHEAFKQKQLLTFINFFANMDCLISEPTSKFTKYLSLGWMKSIPGRICLFPAYSYIWKVVQAFLSKLCWPLLISLLTFLLGFHSFFFGYHRKILLS